VKVLLVVILALLSLGYFIMTYHSPLQTAATDPHYVEVRINYLEHDVQLVGVAKMNSYEDCKVRSLLVWAHTLKHLGDVSVNSECMKELPKKYLKLFENKQANASYIVFNKGSDGERDGRFLIYGVPSSIVYQKCETIIKRVKENFSGEVFCVRGAVG